MAWTLASALILIAVLLHAPWTGYTTHFLPDKVDTLTLLQRCPQIGRASEADVSHAELLRRFDENLACAVALHPEPVPIKITRWRTRAPAFHAVSRLRNVAAGILLVLLATSAFTFAVRRWNIRAARP